MQVIAEHKVLSLVISFVLLILLTALINFLIIAFSGTTVPTPEIPRDKITLGTGPKLNYLIFGDSSSISQGGDYQNGYAVGTATKLSENYQVTYQNFGVSGARINDVLQDQLPRSEEFVPDLVLIAIGANDVTHLTSLKSIESDMNEIISKIKARNPNVKIVFTGSAAMGSVTRFPQPTKSLAAWQTGRVNKVMEKVAQDEKVIYAYIARETGQTFKDNPDLFSQDKFHPSDKGYAVWTEVLNKVIASSL